MKSFGIKPSSVALVALAAFFVGCASEQLPPNTASETSGNHKQENQNPSNQPPEAEPASVSEDATAESNAIELEELSQLVRAGSISDTAAQHERIALFERKARQLPPGYQFYAPAGPNNENYLDIDENDVKQALAEPLSTFSIDVDTASYSNVRRFLERNGSLPPKDAIKLEEMVNYFSYDYPTPENLDQPFSVTTEVAPAPWNEEKYLMQIGLKGYEPNLEKRPAANLVFLVDVSGSMQSQNKLPLLKKSLELLVNQMTEEDRIALVVYAGSAGLVLDSTSGKEKSKIMRAINNLEAGGSTHGSAGIKLAYQVAQENMVDGGINRILIASDGDMNVGVTSVDALKELIEEKRKSGIALTTLGFGTGNYNDAIMEQLADVGNGNAAYIDSLKEAQKVLVNEMQSTLLTIAKDVKIQVEFNPELVSEYRLLGYENRLLNTEDFRNDKVDAGEIGAGHTVTALYEITPVGSGQELIPDLRYHRPAHLVAEKRTSVDGELAYIRLRYKEPNGSVSKEIGQPVMLIERIGELENASNDLRFSSAVAGFAQLLRNSDYTGEMTYEEVLQIARNARGDDPNGYRSEFLSLVELAQSLSTQRLSVAQ